MTKNPHAQALGSLGGKKTAKNMTKEQRVARAKKAVQAREDKRAITHLRMRITGDDVWCGTKNPERLVWTDPTCHKCENAEAKNYD